jgi:hypothetical protein
MTTATIIELRKEHACGGCDASVVAAGALLVAALWGVH